MTKTIGLAALFALLGSIARAEAVITPNTEPSRQTIGGKDAKPASSPPGAGTVQGRQTSNGEAPGEADPDAAPTKPGK